MSTTTEAGAWPKEEGKWFWFQPKDKSTGPEPHQCFFYDDWRYASAASEIVKPEEWEYLGPCRAEAETAALVQAAQEQMREACKSIALQHISKIEINEPLWHEGQYWAAKRISEAIDALPLTKPDLDAKLKEARREERERLVDELTHLADGLSDNGQSGHAAGVERAIAHIRPRPSIARAAAEREAGNDVG